MSLSMTLYLPSAQAKKGDEYLEDARALRDSWKDVIPRGDLSMVQNRLTMLACGVIVPHDIRLAFTLAYPGQRR
jgi:hypothetical protein